MFDGDGPYSKTVEVGREVSIRSRRSSSARETFGHIERQTPHLIFLDVKLPDQSGLHVCRTLREQSEFRQIPIIMMTGYGDKDAVVTGLMAGADDSLPKLFLCDELQARAAAPLRRKG